MSKNVKPQKTVKYLTHDEVQKVISTETQARNRIMFETLFQLGVRVSELTNLHVEDFDFKAGTVHISHEKAKRGKERIVPVPQRLAEMLRDWIKVNQIKDRIFPITRNRVHQITKRAGERAGISGTLHPHRFRHAHAVHLLHKTNNLKAVQENLGHSSISLTAQFYARIPGPQMKQLVNDAFAE